MKNIFLTSSAWEVLDKIVPFLEKQPSKLKVAFIPTAADPYGPEQPWMKADRDKLVELGFRVFDFDLKNKSKEETVATLSAADIIFIGGGNTFYLLEKAKACGFDKLIKKLIANGKIYIGSSAGSCIAGPDIKPLAIFDDPSRAALDSSKAFNLVDFVVLPHYGRDKYGEYHEKVLAEYEKQYKMRPLRDDQLIVMENSDYTII